MCMSAHGQTTSTKLLPITLLSQPQRDASDRLLDCDRTFLIGHMGCGKTVVALTAISELLRLEMNKRILIITTKKIAETVWRQEAAKWEHTNHLKINLALGTEAQRNAAILESSDICVINFENAAWFFNTYKKEHNFDGLLIDELTKLKSHSSNVFKTMRRKLGPFIWRAGMTGTPVSENFLGLYSMSMVLDDGLAYGTSREKFLAAYFYPEDFERRNWALRFGGERELLERLNDMLHVLPDYRQSLPDIIYNLKGVTLPDSTRARYNMLAKHFLLDLGGDGEVIAQNAAVLAGKLQQIASGFAYDTESDEILDLHYEKIKALRELLEKESQPVIVVYWFQADLDLIKESIPCSVLAEMNTAKAVEEWNAGRLNVLLMHPRSAGHGLDMAKGGARIIWYGPQWSRDLWEQTNARLWRMGQTKTVYVTTIVSLGTVDELIVARVSNKARFEKAFEEHLRGLPNV